MNTQAVEARLREAAEARQRGNLPSMRRALDAVLALNPVEPRAHNMLGMTALGEGQHNAAANHFQKAIAGDPKEPTLHINLATAARLMGDDARELDGLQGAIALDQRQFMAWLRKAELHQRRGEGALALQAWQAALALSAQLDGLPPQITEALAKGGAWMATQTQSLATQLDTAMGADIARLSPPEQRRVNAFLGVMTGQRTIYTNHCEGPHFPFLPADEYFDEAHFPWLAEIEAKTDAIRAELQSLLTDGAPGLRPYVHQEPGTPVNKWSPLDNSLDWGAYFLWEYGVKQEEACARCPETAKALEALPRADMPGRAPSAFFSLLRPGKHIPPHTGVTNTRAIVHLPLIVPPGCGFRVGGETREWVEGRAHVFDDTIDHEAWNTSDELRAILIFDVWNPHLTQAEREMIVRFCEVADSTGLNPARLG